MSYIRQSTRLTVQFIDSESEEVLFELKDRNWMNVGEVFTSSIVSSIMENELKNKTKPENILVMVVDEYTLKK
ncbi:MAG: hypothetical protein ACOC22_03940 [bacterium]